MFGNWKYEVVLCPDNNYQPDNIFESQALRGEVGATEPKRFRVNHLAPQLLCFQIGRGLWHLYVLVLHISHLSAPLDPSSFVSLFSFCCFAFAGEGVS